ncbi:MAG TPA: hypothetical protein V6C57_16795 [Coleofasciculaceae cyanobacterium]
MNDKKWLIAIFLIELTALIPASIYVFWFAPLPWKLIYLGCLWSLLIITQIRHYFQFRELRRIEESFKQLLEDRDS